MKYDRTTNNNRNIHWIFTTKVKHKNELNQKYVANAQLNILLTMVCTAANGLVHTRTYWLFKLIFKTNKTLIRCECYGIDLNRIASYTKVIREQFAFHPNTLKYQNGFGLIWTSLRNTMAWKMNDCYWQWLRKVNAYCKTARIENRKQHIQTHTIAKTKTDIYFHGYNDLIRLKW